MCVLIGEEYVKSLIANPDLVDRLACISDAGVCCCLFFSLRAYNVKGLEYDYVALKCRNY